MEPTRIQVEKSRLPKDHLEEIINNLNAVTRFFSAGPYFIFVADYTNAKILSVQGSVRQLTGIDSDKFLEGGVPFLVSLLHPDESETIINISAFYQTFIHSLAPERRLNLKASLTFRLRRPDGTYWQCLEQAANLLLDEEGTVTHALKYFTNVSHLLNSNRIVLSILDDTDPDNQMFYTFTVPGGVNSLKDQEFVPLSPKMVLSSRELEVLKLTASGLTEKAISDKLNISLHTVKSHRKNMLAKTNTRNSAELIRYGFTHLLI